MASQNNTGRQFDKTHAVTMVATAAVLAHRFIAYDGGYPKQYVRVTKVSAVERTFYDADTRSDYRADLVTADISDPLRYDFTGTGSRRDFARVAGAARVRDTLVADAASYAGVTGLQAPIALGAFSAKAGSIYTALVPSAQTETPIVSALPYSAAGLPVPGQAPVTYTAAHDWTPAINFYLPGGCLPGSLSIATAGPTITDDGGLLKTASGEIGRIDYANGILTLSAGSMSGPKTVTYRPAAQLLRAPQSTEVAVTIESRSQSYTGVIVPLAQPGTLAVAFRAQNRWYVLADAGNGKLKGLDAAYGAGTYNANTGDYSITLGALPDVGSSLIFTWSAPTQETVHPLATLKATQRIALAPPAGQSIQPGSLSVTWPHESGTGTRSATAGADGTLAGDATGRLNVARSLLDFAPAVLPAPGAQLTIAYTVGPKQQDHFAHPSRDGAGLLPVTASLGAIEAGSLEVEWNTFTSDTVLGTYTLQQLHAMGIADITNTARPVFTGVDPTQYAHDDGAGKIRLNGAEIGTVAYGTGVVTWNPDVVIKIPTPDYAAQEVGVTWMYRLGLKGITYVSAPSLYPNDESGYVKLRYNSAGSTSSANETVTFAPAIPLVPGVATQTVPGSVLLQPPGGAPWP